MSLHRTSVQAEGSVLSTAVTGTAAGEAAAGIPLKRLLKSGRAAGDIPFMGLEQLRFVKITRRRRFQDEAVG